jgi:hypothetical protein
MDRYLYSCARFAVNTMSAPATGPARMPGPDGWRAVAIFGRPGAFTEATGIGAIFRHAG